MQKYQQYLIEHQTTGYNVYNYVDKSNFTTNELVAFVSKVLNKHIPTIHFSALVRDARRILF
jgi:hypothetical protein